MQNKFRNLEKFGKSGKTPIHISWVQRGQSATLRKIYNKLFRRKNPFPNWVAKILCQFSIKWKHKNIKIASLAYRRCSLEKASKKCCATQRLGCHENHGEKKTFGRKCSGTCIDKFHFSLNSIGESKTNLHEKFISDESVLQLHFPVTW